MAKLFLESGLDKLCRKHKVHRLGSAGTQPGLRLHGRAPASLPASSPGQNPLSAATQGSTQGSGLKVGLPCPA